jgi:asparagine synthase (glutamine-hydrolysing)
MCGFAGFLSSPVSSEKGKAILARMAASLTLRGPDEQGLWLSNSGTVGLAHRRLAVLELGPEGRQPMISSSGRFVLVFNGEIYNYIELQAALEKDGANFRGHSDTAVLLDAIERWGIGEALNRVVGMFAFALWDEHEKRLILARDRFGEKPLYYGWQANVFLFGSTLQPLRQHPAWVGGVDRQALAGLVRYDYVPAPLSIHPGIKRLLPGTWQEMAWRNGRWQERQTTYWSALAAAQSAKASPFVGDFSSAVDILEAKLVRTLQGQVLADVPLGAFLSGGIDSSAVVAVMQDLSRHPVKTFTIGFDDPAYDESASAAAVAEYLGTSHTSYRLTQADLLEFIPRLASIYDEPFADASQIPTALVSQLARRDVTVALSGDGGDEIFGGYNRYLLGPRIRSYSRIFPRVLRGVVADCLRTVAPSTWDNLLSFIAYASRTSGVGEKLHKLASALPSENSRELYHRLTTFWHEDFPLLGSARSFVSSGQDYAVWQQDWPFSEQMMLADTLTYLPDDILVKVDRAAMGVSLETRAPFLDHRLFEFVWSLPLEYRIRDKQSKALLRELLCRHVPKGLIERPKSGFAIPIGQYLRGPLRDWAESMLDPTRLRREGYFDVGKVRSVWDKHCAGQVNRHYDLWSILMFQAWLVRAN